MDDGKSTLIGRLLHDCKAAFVDQLAAAKRLTTNESVAAVRPAVGRLVLFSSGREHPHHVEPVRSGERLAVTVAFTCEKRAAVQDFLARAEDG